MTATDRAASPRVHVDTPTSREIPAPNTEMTNARSRWSFRWRADTPMIPAPTPTPSAATKTP